MSNLKHLMVCISGFSGTGKDEVAGRLVSAHGAVQTGLADPAKRHMADLYGWTEHQLFGPSSARNAGDERYPKEIVRELSIRYFGEAEDVRCFPSLRLRENVRDGKRYYTIKTRHIPEVESISGGKDKPPAWPEAPWVSNRLGQATFFIEHDHPRFFLSPREALQQYCEKMNQLHLDTWISKGIDVHAQLATIHQLDALESGSQVFMKYSYSRMMGLVGNDVRDGTRWQPTDGSFITCFADFRHKHEVRLARKAPARGIIPVLIRVKRPSVPVPPFDHRSEMEQVQIPDSEFDFVIDNDGTLDELRTKVDKVVETIKLPGWKHLEGTSL